jgi:hypothetical protein
MEEIERRMTKGWREYVGVLEKQAACRHDKVLLDATGRRGICLSCGATVSVREVLGA